METAAAAMTAGTRQGTAGGRPRILIVRVGAMGDVLHGMPAVAALRAALPQAIIHWAVEPRWAPLLRAATERPSKAEMPLVDGVHLVGAKAWSRQPLSAATFHSVLALRRALRAERYDIALDLQGSIRSALIARGSGAVRVVGSATPREAPARLLYTECVSPAARHVVDQAVELVSAAFSTQLTSPLAAAVPPLPVDAVAEAWCDALLAGSEAPAVFLAPTAGWGAKQWPAQRFGELARELAKRGCRVLVNAAPHTPDVVAERVVEASGNTARAVPCTLPQLIALLRRVHLVVAGDSGPLHLAAALDIPTLALFGPTDPERNGPYGARGTVLRHPSSRTDHRRHAATDGGLAQIDVREVLQAAVHLLES